MNLSISSIPIHHGWGIIRVPPPSYYIFSKSAILWSPLSISLEILDFRNPTMLIKHYRDDHGSFPPIFENKPKFICSHCSNIYISEKSLKAHAFTAHSKKPKRIGPKILVQCSFCEKTYGTKQRLRDHVIMEHENRLVLLLSHIFLWSFKVTYSSHICWCFDPFLK